MCSCRLPRAVVRPHLQWQSDEEDGAPLSVVARADGPESVVFSVSDTGIGIAPEHVSAIFKDYVQLDSEVQRKLRGTGLGLSLSRRFAEILGGSVWVESTLGVGSTFHARLPIRLPEAPDSGVPDEFTVPRDHVH